MLEAGLELFGTRGFAAVSIAEVCRIAQVSRSAFYDQIGTLENLLMAVVSAIDTQAVDRISAELRASAGGPFAGRAQRALRSYLSVTCADTRTARLCYVEIVGVSEAVELWRAQRREAFVALLIRESQAAAARGEIPDRDYRYTALAVIGAANALACEWVTTRGAENGISIDRVATELAHVLAASFTVPIEIAQAQRPFGA